MSESVTCSRCGNPRDLSLVTMPYSPDVEVGRILVYCPNCRSDMAKLIGLIIPIGEVSPEVFLELYRTGKTESDPAIATEIVFGKVKPEIARHAEYILAQKSGND